MMVNLATEFSRRGAHVSLVLSSAEGPLLSLVPPCVSVIDLRSPRVLRSLPGLVRYLRRERPDALLSAMTHANLIALWARRIARGRTRLVVSERNTLSRTSRSSPVIRQRLMPQQRFASVHGIVQNLFRVGRHLLRSAHHRLLRTRAFVEWDAVTCAC